MINDLCIDIQLSAKVAFFKESDFFLVDDIVACMAMCRMCGMYAFLYNKQILVQNVGLRARAYCLKNGIHQEQIKMIKLRSKER